MNTLLNDIKFGLRLLAKSPGFTCTVIAVLALSIGANTVMYSLAHAILIEPLPFEEPEQLVQIWEDPTGQGDKNTVSGGAFLDWRKHSQSFGAMSVVSQSTKNITGNQNPQRLAGYEVSPDFLKVYGIQPHLGRGFLPEEEQPGNNRVVILSHNLWQSRFNNDRSIVGQTIHLNGEAHTVIGILPPPTLNLHTADFYTPFAFGARNWDSLRGAHRLSVIARLKPDVSLAQASEEMKSIRQRIADQYPAFKKDWSVNLVPLREEVVGSVRPIILLFQGIVALVLLIACANVANLFLARATTRTREIAIRTALGAGRLRILRQVLTESTLLAVISGVLGILLAYGGIHVLIQLCRDTLPRAQSVALNLPVMLFTLGAALGTGLLFGLLPAFKLAGRTSALNEGRQNSAPRARRFTADALVVSEVALALVLLIGAGLLVRSFQNVTQVTPGFNPKNALTMEVSLPGRKYPTGDDRARFLQQAFEKIENLPGVKAVGASTGLPMTNLRLQTTVHIPGRADHPEFGYPTQFDNVSGDYFDAMDIPLRYGRVFTQNDDRTDAPRSVVLNQALAKNVFPGENAVGQQLNMNGQMWTVIGVVGDVRHIDLYQEADPRIYVPQAFASWSRALIVRTTVPPLSLAKPVREAIQSIDAEQPVAAIRTLEQVIDHSLARQKLMLSLSGFFAALGLLFAILGLYGVVAYLVSQRHREIGVRMALGAKRRDIHSMILGYGLKLSLLGTALGIAGALALTRIISAELFGINATDPAAFAVVSGLLITVALAACYLPARRAAKIHPMEALRHE